ncbi:MAG: hybrid sensor histidine kinase/response regulator [Proteobacteria bacterium]|nr:MAG: hybrid sensor histidine kinase/response regulator [Pseudomonadota bacterium]
MSPLETRIPNMAQIDSVLAEYLAECDELIQRVAASLRSVEKSEHTADTIDSIYRDIHTVKGSAQLFGYLLIGDIGHAMETSLDPVRREKRAPGSHHLELLHRGLDAIEKAAAAIRRGEDPVADAQLAKLIAELATTHAPAGELRLGRESAAIAAVESALSPRNEARAPAMDIAKPIPAALAPAPAPAPAAPAEPKQDTKAEAKTESKADAEATSSIRVPVAVLDKLMLLMGEMVLVRNQVLQYANRVDALDFSNLSQRLDIVTSELQGEVMKTRMQPIGNVLSKFHRVVRDLSRDLNKKIDLQLSGMETELDKTLLEAVKDPIMHIVRNSCDHGLENPDERRGAGKPEAGSIHVRSFHEGGQVIVEISDDGRGLNRDKLTAKAVEKGLLPADKAALLSDREAYNLIFAPGFSTAAAVTNVSGRGVGMDVVKSNIEGIGGMVELSSRLGHGTVTRLKIPLTLAIVPAMIVRSGEERFAIPQVKLVELVRVEKNVGANQIELLHGHPIFRLRGSLLPLLSLDAVLGTGPELTEVPDVCNIVVLNAEGKLFGLLVDEVQDTAEVVVKPLSGFLKSLVVYSGATVLGDGSVALILDVMGIAQKSGLSVDGEKKNKPAAEGPRVENQEFLLFTLNSPTKHAIPLNLVHRLEEIPRDAVELSGNQRVVRYRDSVLPIIALNDVLKFGPSGKSAESETMALIVLQKAGRLFGIEVDEILDVLNTPANMDESVCDRPGLLGNLFTTEEIIVVVDALFLLDEFTKRNLPSGHSETPPALRNRELKILFVEDTAFFRKHVTAVLLRAGFKVTQAHDGQQALDALNEAAPGAFDLVLSDIEMPVMNGMELVARVRQHARWASVPMLALTTKFNAAHAEEGRRAGFDAYLEKLNQEILLKAIDEVMSQTRTRRAG